MPETKTPSHMDAIARCFDDSTYSDLTIKCHDRSWKVHRVIVCSQSKVLHAACMTGFKEQHTGVIDLEDEDPVALEIMLKYFYTSKYNDPVNDPVNENNQRLIKLRDQVLTHNLADKYDVQALMVLAAKNFKSTLEYQSTAGEYLSLISDVYTVTTSTNALRAVVVEYARTKFREMMQSADLEILRATLREVPDFAFDVLQIFVESPLRGACHSCGPIQNVQVLQARCTKCGKGGVTVTQ